METDARQLYFYIPLPEEIKNRYGKLNLSDGNQLDHITLLYVPYTHDQDFTEEERDHIQDTALAAVSEFSPISARIQGWAYFDGAKDMQGEDATALVALVDAPGLGDLHIALRDAITDLGYPADQQTHGFTPHATFAYLEPGSRAELPVLTDAEFKIDSFNVMMDEAYPISIGVTKGTKMPYQRVQDLPEPVRDALPLDAQEIWRQAYNSSKSEAAAWGAIKRAGWEKRADGTWTKDGVVKAYAVEGKLLPGKHVPDALPIGHCSIAFVGASPSAMDAQRGEPFAGRFRKALIKEYLDPVGVDPAGVALLNIVPVHLVGAEGRARVPNPEEMTEWLPSCLDLLKELKPDRVVSFGILAGAALDKVSDIKMSHPVTVVLKENNEPRVRRKMRQLMAMPLTGADRFGTVESITDASSGEQPEQKVRFIAKSSDEDKRIVGGIALEPDVVDSQDDHETAEEIEKTAWRYVKESRKIGFRHAGILKEASLIESHIVRDDRGFIEIEGERINNGSWFVVVHCDDASLWQAVKSGELDGFSIGGDGKRTPD